MILSIVIIFFMMFVNWVYSKKYFNIGIFLFLLYLGSFGFSLMLYHLYDVKTIAVSSFESEAYLTVCIILSLLPMCFLDLKFKGISIRNTILFKFLDIWMVGISGLLILLSVSKGFALYFDGSSLFKLRGASSLMYNPSLPFLLNVSRSVVLGFFPYMQSRFFMELNKRKWVAFLFLVSSLSYPIYVLVFFVGRDGIVFWTMCFFVNYVIFKNFITARQRKKIKKYFLFIVGGGVYAFAMISFFRFASRPEGVFYYIFSYYGQQYFNFVDLFQANFASFFSSFNFDTLDFSFLIDSVTNEIVSQGVRTDVFRFFFGSWLLWWGKVGLVVILFLYCVVFLSVTLKITKKKCIKIEDFILFQLFYNITMFGVFYYKHYAFKSHILFVCLIYFYVKIYSFIPKTRK